MFELLVELYENKTLTKLISRGFMSVTVLHELEVAMWINARMTANKELTRTVAVFEASHKFNRSESYVWRCVRKFK